MTTSQFLFAAWNANPAVLLPVLTALGLYVAVYGIQPRLGWFLAGLITILATLLSPLNALASGYLFSAHMAQHILLLQVVPALLLLGLPPAVSLALPPGPAGHPLLGWLAGVGAMWLWHLPALCNAAGALPPVHAVQTVSLLLLGALFWRPVLAPRGPERLAPPAAVLYLFSACVTCSVLGIIITFSPVAVCSIYSHPPTDLYGILPVIRGQWGFTPARDQQVGGLLMWVPMCLIYLSSIFAQIARWYAEPTRRGEPSI